MAPRDRRVVWSAQARRQLDEAVEYISKDSVEAAQRVLLNVLEAASSLSMMSERGRVVPELFRPAVREVFVHTYRLIYEVGPAQVEILAFLHGARDFAKWRRGQGGSGESGLTPA